MALITDQLNLASQYRVPVAIGLGLAAGVAAILMERKEAAEKSAQSGSSVLPLLSVAVALGGITWLVHLRKASSTKSPAAMQGETCHGRSRAID